VRSLITLIGVLGTAPFPDVAVLFEQVRQNQKVLEAVRNDYTYTRTEHEVGSDGHPKESSVRTYEVFSVHGKHVEKLVAKNGRPLTPDEARKEEKRVEKAVREHQKKASERAEDDDEDDLTVSEVLRVCQFVNARREPFRGGLALVYDFEPRPGARPKGRLESWIRKLRGRVLVDEEAKQILRLEARVEDPVKMGGGLVFSVRRGSSFAFEQALVNGEVWLPSAAEVSLSARFLLLKGYDIRQVHRFSDYRKFAVDTSSEIKPPEP
jgi:hypothetical protein